MTEQLQIFMSIFITYAFWYGMVVASILSFFGYGVFKALSLFNINKH